MSWKVVSSLEGETENGGRVSQADAPVVDEGVSRDVAQRESAS